MNKRWWVLGVIGLLLLGAATARAGDLAPISGSSTPPAGQWDDFANSEEVGVCH